MTINPIKCIRFAAKVIRYWRKVRGRTSLSLYRQLLENYRLLRLNLMEPIEYYEKLELFKPKFSWADKQTFLTRNQFALLCKAINPPKAVGIFDKLNFNIYARHFELPVPEFYGLFDTSFGFTASGGPLRDADEMRSFFAHPEISEFMIKPTAGWKGKGNMLGRTNANGTLHIAGQGDLTVEQVCEQMRGTHYSGNKSVNDSWLIDARVRQHPFFDRYTDSCTQTARIVTYITRSGEVEVLSAVMKITVAGRYVDTLGEVGMTAPLADDGVMGSPIKDAPAGGLLYFDRHPETDAPISGEKIPDYDKAVALALRAQSVVPQLRSIGWDIAITENGPVILEGNTYWGWYVMPRGFPQGILTGALAEEVRELMQTTP